MTLIVSCLLAGTAAAAHLTATCSAGRFVVAGKALGAGDTTVSLSGDRVSIPGMCPDAPARLVGKRGTTKITAHWDQCGDVAGPVRLVATVRGNDCGTLRGRLRGKRLRRSFRATRYLGDPAACVGENTFDQVQRRIFGPRGCRVQTCHGADLAGGLDLRLDIANGSLVNVPAANAAAAAAGKRRVVPDDVEASFLWQKLTGHLQPGEGGRMPQVGRLLDDVELDLLRAWIEDGAPLDRRVNDAPCLPHDTFTPAPALTPPPGGYQIAFEGPTLQPGQELEACMWVHVPNAEDFAVGEWEYSLNPGSHHFAFWEHVNGPEPALNVLKKDVACFSGGARPDGVTISGSPESPYFVDVYPPGVGRIVPGGSLIGINPHYYNEFDVPIQIKGWINLHPVAGGLQHESISLVSTFARLGDKSTYSINVAPNTRATLRVRYTNDTDKPWHIFQLSSHEHQRGIRFTAWKSDGTQLFENLDWSHPPIIDYNPPLVLPPGDYIEYECEQDNGVSRPLRRCGDSPADRNCTPGDPLTLKFGLSATDEMCLLVGKYYTD